MHNRQWWNRIIQPKFSVGGFREKHTFEETHEFVLLESFYVQEIPLPVTLLSTCRQTSTPGKMPPLDLTPLSYSLLLPPQQSVYLLKDFPHFLIKANRNSVNGTIKPPSAQPLPFSVTPAHVSTGASWRSTGGR